MSSYYLNTGIPTPSVMNDGLDRTFWEGLRDEKVFVQRCGNCHHWQWGPEWLCHHCFSFDMKWEEVAPTGRIYSWERNWHPAHPALKDRGPYLVVLVELPQAGNIRMVGNLLGDPMQQVKIGASVRGIFEHHNDGNPPFTLLQWTISS